MSAASDADSAPGRLVTLLWDVVLRHCTWDATRTAVCCDGVADGPFSCGVTVRHLGSINGAISLNTYVESNAASCFDVLRQKGRRVSLEECFDGKLGAPRCFDWSGTDFVRLK